jgi:GAF domain-containing protein
MTSEGVLARTLVDLADTLVDEFDIVDLLTRLADHCVEVFDVDAAGIMLAGPDGRLRVMAYSSDATRALELFELQAQEGPCLESHRTGMAVVDPDLSSAESRWPRFAAEARDAGFQSVHALPMRLRGAVIGALNLFRSRAGAMTASEVDVAQAFADIATIGILQHRAKLEAQDMNEQLQHALNSRVVIEQAKGMVAERLGLNVERAFEVMRNHARDRNVRFSDLAAAVISGAVSASSFDPRPTK